MQNDDAMLSHHAVSGFGSIADVTVGTIPPAAYAARRIEGAAESNASRSEARIIYWLRDDPVTKSADWRHAVACMGSHRTNEYND